MCTTLILALEVRLVVFIASVLNIQGVCGSHCIAMFALFLCSAKMCAQVEMAGTQR